MNGSNQYIIITYNYISFVFVVANMETAAVEEQRKNISAFTKFWSIHVNRFVDIINRIGWE